CARGSYYYGSSYHWYFDVW
nr:immunoglobulin heavy chain junction region [Mus musculus]MBK4186318.1 immunoglobulin heavy chain junction region [Mus musculus]MBK4186320.1 immunoglobulin heavy chain junction region [Mus musculus]MBK4186321.1 immunoglobulin heavy chain junction region [Mus musculus]MBK4186322.1 immunoglobulin heavy chain junction region [Mus musculus]